MGKGKHGVYNKYVGSTSANCIFLMFDLLKGLVLITGVHFETT